MPHPLAPVPALLRLASTSLVVLTLPPRVPPSLAPRYAHSRIADRILWIGLTVSGSLASAVGIQLAQHLGAGRLATARRVLASGLGLTSLVLGALFAAIVGAPRALAAIFTDDQEVVAAFGDVRYSLAAAAILMNLACVLEGFVLTAGRTRTVLVAGLAGSWIGQVPTVYALLAYWRRDLHAVYIGVATGYALLCALLLAALACLDWKAVSAEAQARAQPTAPRDEEAARASDRAEVTDPAGATRSTIEPTIAPTIETSTADAAPTADALPVTAAQGAHGKAMLVEPLPPVHASRAPTSSP